MASRGMAVEEVRQKQQQRDIGIEYLVVVSLDNLTMRTYGLAVVAKSFQCGLFDLDTDIGIAFSIFNLFFSISLMITSSSYSSIPGTTSLLLHCLDKLVSR